MNDTIKLLDAAVAANEPMLYIAMELSAKTWRLCFGDGTRTRQRCIEAGDFVAFCEESAKAKEWFGLPADALEVSCYEAGRDGFWIHRQLAHMVINNLVVDAGSIEVSRRRRRAKTDRLDAQSLLEKLVRYVHGERRIWQVVRVPSPEWEDRRESERERGRLLSERNRHRHRISSALVRHGVHVSIDAQLPARLDELLLDDDLHPLAARVKAAVLREYERLCLVEGQLRALECEQRREIANDPQLEPVRRLMLLSGLGPIGAYLLVLELFGWRRFANRRELAALAGLVPMPYNSGEMARDQGISKAGNKRVRALMIELAWLWLRYQPQSKHSRWFAERFGGGSKRQRRIGIVALARRLLVDFWRFLEQGVVPAGAKLKLIETA